MGGYYRELLAADRLKACYDLAPPRTRQYLEAEMAFVLEKTSAEKKVLELGCGYGRVLKKLLKNTHAQFGIDTSRSSLTLAREFLGQAPTAHLAVMNAIALGFRDRTFDLTLCLQNGISAFAVDCQALFQEARRVTRPGGTILFSSYSERFWGHRLEWFEAQADQGLIGPIDYGATIPGTIVCKDGFRASTVDAKGFKALAAGIDLEAVIIEVDHSSLFCEMVVR